MLPAHLLVGKNGEERACAYLKKKGYKLLHKNWRKGVYELDCVCKQADTLVFVEVKTRKNRKFGNPSEFVDYRKQKTLMRAASEYLSQFDLWETPCRFDIVEVIVEDNGEIIHMENAFTAEDMSWQP